MWDVCNFEFLARALCLVLAEPVLRLMWKGASAGSVQRRVKLARRALPFECGTQPGKLGNLPRNLKDKQRSWLLDGLRAMQAPLVAWFG